MSEETPSFETLFARLLCDVMIPAELSAAIRAQGYDVAEARALPVEIQQDDHAILWAAAQQRRVVVTCNYSDPQSNFCLIHCEPFARITLATILVESYTLACNVQRLRAEGNIDAYR